MYDHRKMIVAAVPRFPEISSNTMSRIFRYLYSRHHCVISGLSRYFSIFLKHPECTTQFDETTLVCHYKYLSLNFLQPVPQQQVLISHYAIEYSNSVTLSCDKLSENVSNSKLLRRSTEQHVRPVGSIPRLPIHRRCSIGSRGNGVVCEHSH